MKKNVYTFTRKVGLKGQNKPFAPKSCVEVILNDS